MTTLLLSHPACLDHLTPMGHPERPDRLRAIERALEHEKFQTLAREQAPMASLETIALAHPMDYVEQVREARPKEGMVRLDADTTMSPGTFEAALRAAGGAVQAVDEVMTGKVDERLRRHAPARPSRRDRDADGLLPVQQCGDRGAPRAEAARRRARRDRRFRRASRQRQPGHLLERPDRDVLLDPPDAALSRHRRGVGARRAATPSSTRRCARATAASSFATRWRPSILPRLEGFAPDLVIISAGFDAHMRDPLANLNFLEPDYTWVTQKLMEVADRRANGRVVSLLEGGYDLEGRRELGRRARDRADAGVARSTWPVAQDSPATLPARASMAETTKPTSNKLTFEKALAELEQIVQKLERGDVPLEESVTIYERGEALKRRCEELLRQAEARVEKITLDAPASRPAPSRWM